MTINQNNISSLNSSILILLFFINSFSVARSQSINIKNQDDVDNFSENHQGLSQVSIINIDGEDINNLDGLSQITSIEFWITIGNTSLENLNGLENIEMIGPEGSGLFGIFIVENKNLTSIQALENVKFKSPNGEIVITNNTQLSDCSLSFICNHLKEFRVIVANGNGTNCSNQSGLYTGCNINYNISNKEIIYEYGFEDWNDTFPNNFQLLFTPFNNSDPNVRKVDALTEGEYALSISNNIGSIDSQVPTLIYTTFPSLTKPISMELDCNCKGDGICQILAIENFIDEEYTLMRPIWELRSEDTSTYTIQFQDLIHSENVDEIIGIGFIASERNFLDSGIAEFTIDNVKIYQESSTLVEDMNSISSVYPNPTSGKIIIKSSDQDAGYQIFDNHGLLLKKTNDKSDIDLSSYPSGIYYLKIDANLPISVIKIVKH